MIMNLADAARLGAGRTRRPELAGAALMSSLNGCFPTRRERETFQRVQLENRLENRYSLTSLPTSSNDVLGGCVD